MLRRVNFVSIIMVVALTATGCFGLFSSKEPVAVTGTVNVEGSPGDVNAKVVVLGRSEIAEVSSEGGFKLELPPSSKYTLVALADGHDGEAKEIVVDKDPVTVDFDLNAVSVHEFDFSDPVAQAKIAKTWPSLNFEFRNDPYGDRTLFFPKGAADQAPPEGYQHMRFALLDIGDVDTFGITLEQMGHDGVTSAANGGNRSLSVIFGYEDINNWWVVYYTYTDATRVARMIDGEQKYICRPQVEGEWMPSDEKYQVAEIRLERVGDEMVVRSYANGEPTIINDCSFPASDYNGGKIGLGGHSTSAAQSWFFKNVVVETD